MFSSITINYSGRDFFGQYEARSDEYCGTIDKAVIRKVLKAVEKGGYYAHFTREDTSDECVYLAESAKGSPLVWVHFDSAYSQDEPRVIKLAEFRRMLFDELES